MDKNTITGLVLIAILLVGFSFLSRPSEEPDRCTKEILRLHCSGAETGGSPQSQSGSSVGQ